MVKLTSIKVYYLNAAFFTERRDRMNNFLTSLGFRFERIESDSEHSQRTIRISQGFDKLVKTAISVGEYPFLILEDDVELIKDLPETIEIPDDCSLLYLGASLWNCGGSKADIKLSKRRDHFYRIHHSLGCHAILIPNEASANHFIEINNKSIQTGEHTDILFAIESANSVYLTPKSGPYFYQNEPHTKPITNFTWESVIESNQIDLTE